MSAFYYTLLFIFTNNLFVSRIHYYLSLLPAFLSVHLMYHQWFCTVFPLVFISCSVCLYCVPHTITLNSFEHAFNHILSANVQPSPTVLTGIDSLYCEILSIFLLLLVTHSSTLASSKLLIILTGFQTNLEIWQHEKYWNWLSTFEKVESRIETYENQKNNCLSRDVDAFSQGRAEI